MRNNRLPKRTAHVNAVAVRAQRQGMLDEYYKAKDQNQDDPCRTSHGNAAETIFRCWISRFLPKRFGIAKGYIVSPRIDYEMPADEWDVIIYDALESPILYYRNEAGEEKLGLPVESILAVIEVKASLSEKSSAETRNKLRKLSALTASPEHTPESHFLRKSFFCQSVFFETKVDTLAQYRKSLQNLIELCGNEPLRYLGGTVLYSEKLPGENTEYSGYIMLGRDLYGGFNNDWLLNEVEGAQILVPAIQIGDIPAISSEQTMSMSIMWDPNGFYHYLWELVYLLKGGEEAGAPRAWHEMYGADWTARPGARLFHPGPYARFGGFDDGKVPRPEEGRNRGQEE